VSPNSSGTTEKAVFRMISVELCCRLWIKGVSQTTLPSTNGLSIAFCRYAMSGYKHKVLERDGPLSRGNKEFVPSGPS
jgi:hypothetical protein